MENEERYAEVQRMIGKSFDNLTQRSIYCFLATYPSFYPVSDENVSPDEQRAVHGFLLDIYKTLFDNPALLGVGPTPDDCLGDYEYQKQKPKLVPAIRGIISKVEEFMALLWEAALKGLTDGNRLIVSKQDIELKPSFIRLLAAFGAETVKTDGAYVLSLPVSTRGLRLLAQISEKNARYPLKNKPKPYLLFSRGVFDPSAPWSREVFGSLFEDRLSFEKLLDFLEQQGYTRVDNKECGNRISLDYIKCYGSPEEDLKFAWAERTHGGIELGYAEERRNQAYIGLRLPYFNELLSSSEKMNTQVKRFVTTVTKKCDNCRYCVQTDKTGKRPLAAVPVGEYMLCPLFAGFQYKWNTLTSEIADNMIAMLAFIDELFAGKITEKR